jgi:hypothetical protein
MWRSWVDKCILCGDPLCVDRGPDYHRAGDWLYPQCCQHPCYCRNCDRFSSRFVLVYCGYRCNHKFAPFFFSFNEAIQFQWLMYTFDTQCAGQYVY